MGELRGSSVQNHRPAMTKPKPPQSDEDGEALREIAHEDDPAAGTHGLSSARSNSEMVTSRPPGRRNRT